jgi:hypothetical protein
MLCSLQKNAVTDMTFLNKQPRSGKLAGPGCMAALPYKLMQCAQQPSYLPTCFICGPSISSWWTLPESPYSSRQE